MIHFKLEVDQFQLHLIILKNPLFRFKTLTFHLLLHHLQLKL